MEVKTLNKYKNKSISQLIVIATKWFNKYIRLRDAKDEYYFICISCGKKKGIDKMHAGHYIAAGYSGLLRFNEDNVHGQCNVCNTHKHGNAVEYRKKLVNKIGIERVEIMENLSRTAHKWDKIGLINTIEVYKEKCKNFKY